MIRGPRRRLYDKLLFRSAVEAVNARLTPLLPKSRTTIGPVIRSSGSTHHSFVFDGGLLVKFKCTRYKPRDSLTNWLTTKHTQPYVAPLVVFYAVRLDVRQQERTLDLGCACPVCGSSSNLSPNYTRMSCVDRTCAPIWCQQQLPCQTHYVTTAGSRAPHAIAIQSENNAKSEAKHPVPTNTATHPILDWRLRPGHVAQMRMKMAGWPFAQQHCSTCRTFRVALSGRPP